MLSLTRVNIKYTQLAHMYSLNIKMYCIIVIRERIMFVLSRHIAIYSDGRNSREIFRERNNDLW